MPDRRRDRLTVDSLLAEALAVLDSDLDDARKLALVAAQVRLALEIRRRARARRAMERPILDWLAEGEANRG